MRSPRSRDIAISSSAALCGVFALVILFTGTEPYTQSTSPIGATIVTFTDYPTATLFEPGQPRRLVIPKIQVNALVQSVGLVDNTLGVPTNFTDVGWYQFGPRPGMRGSAVIDGHRSGKKVPRGVFFNLNQLVAGDFVYTVDENGDTSTFIVTAVTTYPHDAATDTVFTSDDQDAHLNLITCSGIWDKNRALFTERIVVFTNRVE